MTVFGIKLGGSKVKLGYAVDAAQLLNVTWRAIDQNIDHLCCDGQFLGQRYANTLMSVDAAIRLCCERIAA